MRQPQSRISLTIMSFAVAATATVVSASSSWLLVSGGNGNHVIRYDGEDAQAFDHLVAAGISPLNAPVRMTRGPDGDLYVSSYETDSVLRYDAGTGEYLGVFVASGLGGLNGPWGLLFVGNELLVASANNNRVLKYDASGAFVGTFVNSGNGLNEPSDLVVGSDGSLYVSSHGSDRILRYHGTTGAFLGTCVEAGTSGLVEPRGMVFHPGPVLVAGTKQANVLLVASRGTDQILAYRATTCEFLGIFAGASGGPLEGPNELRLGSDGLLYVVCTDSNSVVRFNLTTAVSTVFISSGSGGINSPRSLLFVERPCAADLNEDGMVDGNDLTQVLGAWGQCPAE